MIGAAPAERGQARKPGDEPGQVISRQISAGNSGVKNGRSDQVSSPRPWRVETKLRNHCQVLDHWPAPRHSGCCAPRTIDVDA